MKKETRQPKKLPALMDGKTMILPAVTLPPPDGDTEEWWEKIARPILLPRWAAECIRDGVIWGQDLRDGESMKERVETIMRTPGEMDKWERLAGWGRNAWQWEAWGGSLVKLVKERGFGGRGGPFDPGRPPLPVGKSKTRARAAAVFYWEAWIVKAWEAARERVESEGAKSGMDGAKRERVARLLAEGAAYWGRPAIVFPGEYMGNNGKWQELDSGDTERARNCLAELLRPPAKRKRNGVEILGNLAEALAFVEGCAMRADAEVWAELHVEAIQAGAEARVADAEAKMYRANNKAKEARAARERADEAQREEAEKRAAAEAWAERVLNTFGHKLDNIESNTAATVAAVAGAGDKEAKADALVGAFKRFFDEVGPDVKPGGEIALAHFQAFILDPKNKAALGRARAFRTFRRLYQEWIDLGRPDTGKDYLKKRAGEKSQKRKRMEAARR